MAVKNLQVNVLVDWVNQVIYNIILTDYLSNKLFDCINPLGDILSSMSGEIIYFYNHTLNSTSVQYLFGRNMIFKLS